MLTDEFKDYQRSKPLEGERGLEGTLILNEGTIQNVKAKIIRLEREILDANEMLVCLEEETDFIRELISERSSERQVLPFEGEGAGCG